MVRSLLNDIDSGLAEAIEACRVVTLKGRTSSPVAILFIDCAREVAKPLISHR